VLVQSLRVFGVGTNLEWRSPTLKDSMHRTQLISLDGKKGSLGISRPFKLGWVAPRDEGSTNSGGHYPKFLTLESSRDDER